MRQATEYEIDVIELDQLLGFGQCAGGIAAGIR
jgi:hypothetical protein